MDTRPRLTVWAEIAQIASLPLGIVTIALAILAIILQATGKWPQWFGIPSGGMLAAIFGLLLALVVTAFALSLSGFRRTLNDRTRDQVAIVNRLESLEAHVRQMTGDLQAKSSERDLVAVRDAVELLRARIESRTPDELEWRGVDWRWNGNSALGPFCPEHKVNLGYQRSSSLVVEFANFDDEWWVGASGRLICPIDRTTFENTAHEKVGQARDAVENRFRAIHSLPPKPPRPLTQVEIEMREQAAESLRQAMRKQGFNLGDPPKP
jgi:hypothetical protein